MSLVKVVATASTSIKSIFSFLKLLIASAMSLTSKTDISIRGISEISLARILSTIAGFSGLEENLTKILFESAGDETADTAVTGRKRATNKTAIMANLKDRINIILTLL